MYNLALPIDVHARAKMFALMEGQSLAEYIINAVRNANDKAAAKYSGSKRQPRSLTLRGCLP